MTSINLPNLSFFPPMTLHCTLNSRYIKLLTFVPAAPLSVRRTLTNLLKPYLNISSPRKPLLIPVLQALNILRIGQISSLLPSYLEQAAFIIVTICSACIYFTHVHILTYFPYSTTSYLEISFLTMVNLFL